MCEHCEDEETMRRIEDHISQHTFLDELTDKERKELDRIFQASIQFALAKDYENLKREGKL